MSDLPAGFTTVTVNGDLDAGNTEKVFTQLADAISTGAHVTVDMSGVPFMDSAGISALVRAHNLAIARGQRLRVTGLQPRPKRILQFTGLLETLT